MRREPLSRVNPAAVVFDCDGLLLDTAPLWAAAEQKVVSARGGHWDQESRIAVHGLSLHGAAAVLAEHVLVAAPTAVLLDEMIAAFRRAVATDGVAPMPGAVGLLRGLGGRCPLAVASNMDEDLLQWVLERAGLSQHFRFAVGATADRRSKPAPDIYLAACAALDLPPERCHALEDSQTGVDAALAAGIPVTGVSSSATLTGCRQVRSLAELSWDALDGEVAEVAAGRSS